MCLGSRVDINQAVTSITKEEGQIEDDAKVSSPAGSSINQDLRTEGSCPEG